MAGREEQGRKERIRDGGFQPGHFRQAGHSPLRNTTTLCGWGNEWCWEIKTALGNERLGNVGVTARYREEVAGKHGRHVAGVLERQDEHVRAPREGRS